MSKFALRPSTFTRLIPGNSQNIAHAGTPSPHKQAHHKLHQIDAAGAQREALAPEFGVAARVRSYLAQPAPEAPAADAPPEPSATERPRTSAKALRRFLGKAGTVLGMRAGKPVSHAELTRYRGSDSATARPIGQDDPRDKGTWRSVGSAQARAFVAAERLHQAEVAVSKAKALERLVQLHIEQRDDDACQAGKRGEHTSAMAQLRRRLQPEIDALLSPVAEKIEGLQQAIADRDVRIGRTRSRQGAEPEGHALRDVMQRDRRNELKDQREVLKTRLAEQLGLQKSLQQRRKSIDRSLAQLERTAAALARDLLKAESDTHELRSLQGGLAQRREGLETACNAARTASEAAATELAERRSDMVDAQIASLPGLRESGTADMPALRIALRGFVDSVDPALFGDQSIGAAGALAVGLQALAVAADGNAGKALQALEALRRLDWSDLIPAPGRPGPSAPEADLPAAAQRAVDQLAHIPRGMQVLVHLLRPSDRLAAAPERLAAARLALRADCLLRAAPPGDAALRTWLGHAQSAARTAAHAAEPAKALAACTVDERAAYHALRNGYESNAPGSAYDRANGHLQKIADALHDVGAHGTAPKPMGGQPNALRSLPEALEVGAATALPTPRRRAGEALEKAAEHLGEMLGGLRAGRPAGHIPSGAERAWQAIAEAIRWAPEGTDRTAMVLDEPAIAGIRERAQALHDHALGVARGRGVAPTEGEEHPALQAAWKHLRSRPHTVPEAMALLAERMPTVAPEEASGPAPGATPGGTQVSWDTYAQRRTTQFKEAVQAAGRLLRDGDPQQVTNGQALLDLTRDMIGQLEWRDRLRLIGQQTFGVNAGPLSAAVAVAASALGLGLRLTAAAQRNVDSVMEFYMGRTGMYLQVGEQTTQQAQLGAGASTGYGIDLGGDKASLGLTAAADWRWRGERGVENGIQLRLPRLGKGREPELNVEFIDAYEHLLQMATPGPDGAPARRDWMRELLAHHPELSAGLIDDAQRSSTGTETNVSASVGLRVGEVADRGRRAGVAASLGLKMRQDNGQTATTVAGYMTTIYRDATATARVEVAGRATASVQFAEALKNTETDHGTKTSQRASASAAGLDLGYARELSADATTNFCTLFLFGDEIDPVRSDRATDYSKFSDFERHVRAEWDGWAQYGTGKLGPEVDPALRHLLADIQLSHFMEQTHAFARGNGFAAMFADKAMRAPAAPLLDVHRALSALARTAGNTETAKAEDAAFDALLQEESMWEPTLLLLREKGKLQAERGLDFFVKHQNNRNAEAMRTVAQWILYEPVPRREPGQDIRPARTWRPDADPAPRAAAGPLPTIAEEEAGEEAEDDGSLYGSAPSSLESIDSFRSVPGSPQHRAAAQPSTGMLSSSEIAPAGPERSAAR
ncbi:XopZ family type III secretion system effector [Paracidovorax konjaci]|uniref:Uncharacterized protein n=1 Tax=Paracidovorax konjaci TaxID=32040 RepID=A0A1I1TFF2_9BURK|nr:XopZ family type III secretion system effector [Paracidovorax konjaci]SFD57377.1 hypothetical protein SAMN04489710_103330 [Paracidovorax konjaci]